MLRETAQNSWVSGRGARIFFAICLLIHVAFAHPTAMDPRASTQSRKDDPQSERSQHSNISPSTSSGNTNNPSQTNATSNLQPYVDGHPLSGPSSSVPTATGLPSSTTTSPSPLQVIEMSVGRSGSTMLQHIISSLPGVFDLLEPYRSFVMQPLMWPAAQLPTTRRFLDCSALANHKLAQTALWGYACDNSAWIRRHLRERNSTTCKHGSIDFTAVHEGCLKSTVRFLKEIRFATGVFDDLPTSAMLPLEAKLVLLVRAPWDVAKSQVGMGWFKNNGSLPPVELVDFAMNQICRQMINQDLLAARHRVAGHFILLQYEDMVKNYMATARRLFEFLDLPSSVVENTLASLETSAPPTQMFMWSTGNHTSIPESLFMERAARLPSCQYVMALYDYHA